MLNISCDNTIEIVAGDKGFINFRTSNHKLSAGDSVIFNIKDLRVTKTVKEFTEAGVACIDLESVDTAHDKGVYEYTIRVITELGVDDTVIIGNFKII